MIKATFFPSAGQIAKELRDMVKKELNGFGDDLLINARAETPIKEGRARRGWVKLSKRNSVRVTNNVPYIELLERNRSKQTDGQGITRPAIEKTKAGRLRR